ncbi:MAG: hypothetical protein N2441_06865 [Rhodocyclaceae bacterium]|nr:hypothetical protein [Rhodocyclaceae bacterium]
MKKWSSNSLLIDSALVLALLWVVVLAYKLSPSLSPRADRFLWADARCDLQRAPCETTLPSGATVSFSLQPRPIEPMRPLHAEVMTRGLHAQRVKVDFAGVEMNMGFLRPTLREAERGRFVGDLMLPACVTGRMLWQATVLIEHEGERLAIAHRFEAGH